MASHIRNYSVAFSVILFMYSLSYSQDSLTYELTYEVNRSSPTVMISPEQFNEIERYTELDIHFKSEWIGKFISADITVIVNGKQKVLKANDHYITEELKSAIADADSGEKVKVSYQYIPKSGPNVKDTRKDGFSFAILPEQDASFPGGIDNMNKYFSDAKINKVTSDDIDIYNLAAIKFTVNDNGDIVNPHVVSKSKHNYVDSLLLNAICDMPSWNPAKYDDGTRIAQDFVLTVGDHTSCTLNTLGVSMYTFKN